LAKTLLLSLLLFSIPVAIAMYLSPSVFESSKIQLDSNYNYSNPIDEKDFESSKSYIEIESNKSLEPSSDKLFVSSITFSVPSSIEEGESVKFFTKYNADKKPYVGWGLRLKKTAGTIRPEVYWQGVKSRGGWHSFAEIDLKYKEWNSITMIASDRNSISLYYQNLESEDEAEYLGGFSINNIASPQNNGKLKLLHPVSSQKNNEIVIFDFVLASIDKEIKSIDAIISKGASALANKIPYDSISLWVDARGKDRSKYNRKL